VKIGEFAELIDFSALRERLGLANEKNLWMGRN
jgi:hypothetical protein